MPSGCFVVIQYRSWLILYLVIEKSLPVFDVSFYLRILSTRLVSSIFSLTSVENIIEHRQNKTLIHAI